jgi:hypothetical protein
MQKFNQEQQNALRHIAQRNGFFFRNHGSQELTEDGVYRVYIDFDTGSAATISSMLGQKIRESKAFKEVDEIYFRGRKIWPPPDTDFLSRKHYKTFISVEVLFYAKYQ